MKAFFLLLLAVPLISPPWAHVQKLPAQRIINLNGIWQDKNRLVEIRQGGKNVKADFQRPYPKCDPRDGSEPKDRQKDFEGTIHGDIIVGKMTVCNFGKTWGTNIGIQEVDMQLRINEPQNELDGFYDGKRGRLPVGLTRVCKPDARNLCDAIGRAMQGMSGALAAPASAAHYQNLQQKIGQELSNIRNNLCDKSEESNKVAKVQQNLESLNFVPGQSNLQNNLAIGKVDTGLKELSNSLCGAFNPPPPPSCAEDAQPKTETDTALLNSFNTYLEPKLPARILGGLKKTKACLTEMFGQSCAPQSFLNDLRFVAGTWNEAGIPSMEVCDRMCQSLGDWYEASACSKGGFEKRVIVDKCKLTCRGNDFNPQ